MLQIKTFGVDFDSSIDDAVKTLNTQLESFIRYNKIDYEDIKKFEITTTQTKPACGGDSSSTFRGRCYLIYTLIIDKQLTPQSQPQESISFR